MKVLWLKRSTWKTDTQAKRYIGGRQDRENTHRFLIEYLHLFNIVMGPLIGILV